GRFMVASTYSRWCRSSYGVPIYALESPHFNRFSWAASRRGLTLPPVLRQNSPIFATDRLGVQASSGCPLLADCSPSPQIIRLVCAVRESTLVPAGTGACTAN